MNIGMDLSNMLAGKIPNTLLQGGQGIKTNNSSFVHMLSMLVAENEGIQSTQPYAENSDLSLMGLFAANVLGNPDILKDAGTLMPHMADMEGAWMGAVEEDGETDSGQNFAYPAEMMQMMNYFEYFNYFDRSTPAGNMSEMDKINELIALQYKPEASAEALVREMPQGQVPTGIFSQQDFSEAMIKNINNINSIKNEEAQPFEPEKQNNPDMAVNMYAAQDGASVQGEKIIVNIADDASQLKPQILHQVGDKITVMAEKGEAPGSIKQVEMELNPEHLGKVSIKMTFDHDKVTVEIKALNKETQEILSSGTGELTELLKKSTDLPVGIVVKSDENQGSNLQNHHNSWNENNRNNENYDRQEDRGRQGNSYYSGSDGEENDEESIFSEMINLRSMKLNV